MSAFVVHGLSKSFGGVQAVADVSFSVEPGERRVLIGPNGAGKTTLVRSIIGLTPPRHGSISYQDVDITRLPAHRIARMGIGLVPQGRRIFPSLSVRENLEVAARGRGRWTPGAILALFPNLAQRLRQPAGKLSGGEQQMLAAGRALVGNPELLLDEPSEGLAPLMVRELGRVIDALKAAGTAVLLVEQHLAFALRHSDHVYIMSKGRIVHHGTPRELAADAQTKSRYLGV